MLHGLDRIHDPWLGHDSSIHALGPWHDSLMFHGNDMICSLALTFDTIHSIMYRVHDTIHPFSDNFKILYSGIDIKSLG